MQLELPLRLADGGRRPGTTKAWRDRARIGLSTDPQAFREQAVDYASGLEAGRSVPDELQRLAEKEL